MSVKDVSREKSLNINKGLNGSLKVLLYVQIHLTEINQTPNRKFLGFY